MMNFKTIVFLGLGLSSVSICSGDDHDSRLFPITETGPGWPQPGSVKGGFIDKTGKVVMQPTSDIMPLGLTESRSFFNEGLEPTEVQLKTKWPPLAWGYLDTKFHFAIEPQFESATPFSEGLAAVRDKKDGPPWSLGYIDHTGKFVIAPQFEEANPFTEGLAQVVNSDHLMGFIDHSGKWVIPPQYLVRAGQSNFSEGLSCVGKKVAEQNDPSKPSRPSSDFIWGYIDKTGAEIIAFKFKEAEGFHDGLAAVQDSDGFGYIDKLVS